MNKIRLAIISLIFFNLSVYTINAQVDVFQVEIYGPNSAIYSPNDGVITNIQNAVLFGAITGYKGLPHPKELSKKEFEAIYYHHKLSTEKIVDFNPKDSSYWIDRKDDWGDVDDDEFEDEWDSDSTANWNSNDSLEEDDYPPPSGFYSWEIHLHVYRAISSTKLEWIAIYNDKGEEEFCIKASDLKAFANEKWINPDNNLDRRNIDDVFNLQLVKPDRITSVGAEKPLRLTTSPTIAPVAGFEYTFTIATDDKRKTQKVLNYLRRNEDIEIIDGYFGGKYNVVPLDSLSNFICCNTEKLELKDVELLLRVEFNLMLDDNGEIHYIKDLTIQILQSSYDENNTKGVEILLGTILEHSMVKPRKFLLPKEVKTKDDIKKICLNFEDCFGVFTNINREPTLVDFYRTPDDSKIHYNSWYLEIENGDREDIFDELLKTKYKGLVFLKEYMKL